jgi:hypothetical protein
MDLGPHPGYARCNTFLFKVLTLREGHVYDVLLHSINHIVIVACNLIIEYNSRLLKSQLLKCSNIFLILTITIS